MTTPKQEAQKVPSDREMFEALFLLAGFRVSKWHELANKYWPPHYAELRERHPWWLAMTQYGPIEIGWRKRVISIRWEDTPARKVVTDDDVTKDETLVHAWDYEKAMQYLSELRRQLAIAARTTEGTTP